MRKQTRGFGLIEVIAAIGLMAIAVLSVGAISMRMARTENSVRNRAAQVTSLRQATAYWSSVPFAALPAAGTQVCTDIDGTTRVRTCAIASTLTVGTATARRLVLTSAALDGAAAKVDSSTVVRSAATTAPPL